MSTLHVRVRHGNPDELLAAAVLRLERELGCEFDLAKAVPVHHSHFQERALSGQFGAPPPNPLPLLPAEDREEARLLADQTQAGELSPRLASHLADYEAGHLSSSEWERRVLKDLRLFYSELYRLGKQAAGWAGVKLTPQDQAILGRLVRDEADYLAKFRSDLDEGAGVMPYPARMQLYANASWEAYWIGFVMGDLTPGRQTRWRYGGTEQHCGLEDGGKALGCSDFAALGWLSPVDFLEAVLLKGYAPKSGALECIGARCLCWIEESRPGAHAAPQGPPYGLASKVVS